MIINQIALIKITRDIGEDDTEAIRKFKNTLGVYKAYNKNIHYKRPSAESE